MTPSLTRLHTGRYLESPRWHSGALWLVDSLTRQVLTVGRDGTSRVVCDLKHVPSGLCIDSIGRVMVASMFKRVILSLADGQHEVMHDLSGVARGTLDDLIADGDDRIYVGDLGFHLHREPPKPASGRLFMLREGCTPRVVADGLQFPNGIAICPRHEYLAVAEMEGNRVSLFSLHDDGSLSKLRVIEGIRAPDGVCFDQNQALWVSAFDDDAFFRYDLEGARLDEIRVAGRRAVACAFGGDSRDQLFLVSAETSTSELANGNSRSHVEVAQVGTPGGGNP